MSPKHLTVGVAGIAAALTGLSVVSPPTASAAPVEIQVLATNDFHGRILDNTGNGEAGAAVLSGAVKQLREANPNTVFAAAGDLIGASTFESFIQDDKPTIDALNEAGLEVSAVGNHELDKGYDDLVERVMAPYDAETNPLGGAEWEYIAANIDEPGDRDEIAESWTREFGDVQVGFVGAVTEDLPSLVSPAGIEGLTVTDIVDATNSAAADLRADGADIVVMLVHEGAPTTECAAMSDASTVWGSITTGVSDDVDAIVSGHTHQAYNCEVEGRPVVSAGQYGTYLNQLLFTVESTTGEVTDVESNLLALEETDPDGSGPNDGAPRYPADPAVVSIVDAAVAEAEVLGAEPLGELSAPFRRARRIDPGATGGPAPVENRGGESTLGNLVAEVQRWATRRPVSGSAQIAFMNPGGLRADMNGEGAEAFPRVLTYKGAAVVQPFANTLINMDLTGAQIETALEQQWQRASDGSIPSRPFLRLGVSDGFEYTYQEYPDPAHEGARLGEVTGMWLNGEPVRRRATYSVTVNSFLASGGDNFREFANGTSKADTGQVDLEAMVRYMGRFAGDAPLVPDYSQRAVEVTFPESAPAVYGEGDHVQFDLASLAMTADGDVQDEEVTVSLGGEELGTFPVDNARLEIPYDDAGTASVDVTVPAGAEPGPTNLIVRGQDTGTRVRVPIVVEGLMTPRVRVAVEPGPFQVGERRRVVVEVVGRGATPTGEVEVSVEHAAGNSAEGVSAELALEKGRAVLRGVRFDERGEVTIEVRYTGDDSYAAARETVTRQVRR